MSKRFVAQAFKPYFDEMALEFYKLIKYELLNLDYDTATRGRIMQIADEVSDRLEAHVERHPSTGRYELKRFRAYRMEIRQQKGEKTKFIIGERVVRGIKDYVLAGCPNDRYKFERITANLISACLGHESFKGFILNKGPLDLASSQPSQNFVLALNP